VRTGPAEQLVGPGVAGQGVAEAAALEILEMHQRGRLPARACRRAAGPDQAGLPGPKVERDRRAEVGPVRVVRSFTAVERVAFADGVGDEEVVSRPGEQVVFARIVRHGVVAAGRVDRVGARAVDRRVLGRRARKGVGPFAAEEDRGARLRQAGHRERVIPGEPGEEERVRASGGRADDLARAGWFATAGGGLRGVEASFRADPQFEADLVRGEAGAHLVVVVAAGQVDAGVGALLRGHQTDRDRRGGARNHFFLASAELTTGRALAFAVVALGPAEDLIVAAAPAQHVGAASAVDRLAIGPPDDQVGERRSDHDLEAFEARRFERFVDAAAARREAVV